MDSIPDWLPAPIYVNRRQTAGNAVTAYGLLTLVEVDQLFRRATPKFC